MFTSSRFLESSGGLNPQNNRPDNSIVTLAMGILTQAIRDLIRPQTRRERDWKDWKEDAETWINSEENDFGTFEWVCSVIRANPSAVKTWIESLEALSEPEKKSTIQMLLRLTYNGNGQGRDVPFDSPDPEGRDVPFDSPDPDREDDNLKKTA